MEKPFHSTDALIYVIRIEEFQESLPMLLSLPLVARSAAWHQVANAMPVAREFTVHNSVENMVPCCGFFPAIDAV